MLRLAQREKCFVDMADIVKGLVDFWYVCEDFISEKRTGCCFCPKWYYVMCVLFSGIKQGNIFKINLRCTPCLHKATLATKFEIFDEFK